MLPFAVSSLVAICNLKIVIERHLVCLESSPNERFIVVRPILSTPTSMQYCTRYMKCTAGIRTAL